MRFRGAIARTRLALLSLLTIALFGLAFVALVEGPYSGQRPLSSEAPTAGQGATPTTIGGNAASSSITVSTTNTTFTNGYSQVGGNFCTNGICSASAVPIRCVNSTVTDQGFSYTTDSCSEPYEFPSQPLANTTLDSPQVQGFLRGAYNYSILSIGYFFAKSGLKVYHTVLEVTGSQAVAGNWSSAYSLSYTGSALLNVTVTRTTPGRYNFSGLQSVSYPDTSSIISFSPEQRQMIGMAFSNSTVRADLSQADYYVQSVLASQNASSTGAYLVQFYQADGIDTVRVYVNPTSGAVVGLQKGTRVRLVACGSNGACLTDPWTGPRLSVNEELAVFVNINYVGPWSLVVVGYNKTNPAPSEPVSTLKLNGAGNFRTQIPLFKSIDGPDIVATAQKLDGSNAALSVNVDSPNIPQMEDVETTDAPYGNATSSFAVSCNPIWLPELC